MNKQKIIITAFNDQGFHKVIGEFSGRQIFLSYEGTEAPVTRKLAFEEIRITGDCVGMIVTPSEMPAMVRFMVHVEETGL